MDEILMSAIQKELQKCKDDPYYFATTYLKIYDSDGNSHPYISNSFKRGDKVYGFKISKVNPFFIGQKLNCILNKRSKT